MPWSEHDLSLLLERPRARHTARLSTRSRSAAHLAARKGLPRGSHADLRCCPRPDVRHGCGSRPVLLQGTRCASVRAADLLPGRRRRRRRASWRGHVRLGCQAARLQNHGPSTGLEGGRKCAQDPSYLAPGHDVVLLLASYAVHMRAGAIRKRMGSRAHSNHSQNVEPQKR